MEFPRSPLLSPPPLQPQPVSLPLPPLPSGLFSTGPLNHHSSHAAAGPPSFSFPPPPPPPIFASISRPSSPSISSGSKASSAAAQDPLLLVPQPPPPPPPTAPVKKVLDLPKISFRIVDERKREGVSDGTSQSYGYNNSADFERPEHYIRHIEPIESELKNQVEYDMDEQDQEWLEDLNRERAKDHSDAVSYELFEIVMDRFEKEWFDLTKLIPNTKASLPSEDSPCGVCDDGEGENSNAIVFCDGCNLAVHQDCYGVPYIPEGQWLCRKCTVSPEYPVNCLLCPAEGGAFKQTSAGQWAHLLCAIWIPECGVGNSVYMEPIDGVESVPKSRWKLTCSICKKKNGACIQCDNKLCYTAFHVSCGRENGLLGSMKTMGEGHGPGGGDGVLRGWCEKHVPDEVQHLHAQRHPHSAIAARLAQNPSSTPKGRALAVVIKKTKKSARAYAKTYLPPPPLVPAKIFGDITEYVGKMQGRKKKELIELIGRYWSLKREARRGAPLLKRLHLEPWTASGARVHTEAEKEKKMQYLVRIRNDLESVRMLCEMVEKREKQKLKQSRILKDALLSILFPHDAALEACLEKISSHDKGDVFTHPVSRAEVPDYYDVIKTPMSWLTIEEKLDRHVYVNMQEFKDDIALIFDNAQLYNEDDSTIFKLAARIRTAAEPLLAELDSIKNVPLTTSTSLLEPSVASTSTSTDPYLATLISHLTPGDLEPPLELLSLLTQVEDPADPSGLDALDSLFNFKLLATPPRSPKALPVIEEVDPAAAPDPPAPSPLGLDGQADVDMEEPNVPVEEAPAPKIKKAWDQVKEKERRAARAAEKEVAKVGRREKKLVKQAAEAALAAEAGPVQVAEAAASLEPMEEVVVAQAKNVSEKPAGRLLSPETSTRSTRTRRVSLVEADSAPALPPPPPGPASVEEEFEAAPIPEVVVAINAEVEITPEGPEKHPSSRKRKRKSTPEPTVDREVPRAVPQQLDDHDTFMLFETGWILPEGSRRGGRTAEPREASPMKTTAKKPRSAWLKQTAVVPQIEAEVAGVPGPDDASTSAQPMDVDEASQVPPAPAPASFQPEVAPPRLRDETSASPTKGTSSGSALSEVGDSEANAEDPTVGKVTAQDLPTTKPLADVEEAKEPAEEAEALTGPKARVRVKKPRKSSAADDMIPVVKTGRSARPAAAPLQSDPIPAPAVDTKGKGRASRSTSRPAPALEPEPATEPRASRSRKSTGGAAAAAPTIVDKEEGPVASTSKEPEEQPQPRPGRTRKGRSSLIKPDDVPVASSSTAAPTPLQPSRKGKERGPAEPEMVEDVTMDEPAGPDTTETPRRAALRSRGRKETEETKKAEEEAEKSAPPEDVFPISASNVEYQHGTLVWVRIPTYPFFPGQVVVFDEVDEDDGEVLPPQAVMEIRARLKGKEYFLIRFFDKTRTWAWVERRQMKLLGEDKAVDAAMVSEQKFTSKQSRQKFMVAYEQCLSEMAMPGEFDEVVEE